MTGTDILTRVVNLGDRLVKAQDLLGKAEGEVAKIKAQVLMLEREELPTLMAEAGISEVKLAASGKTIRVQQGCDAKISEENKPRAFAYLIERGFGGLIKVHVDAQFGKGERVLAQNALGAIQKVCPKAEVELEESIHPQTLKAFVKERLEAGDPVPLDLFGVFIYNKAVVSN